MQMKVALNCKWMLSESKNLVEETKRAKNTLYVS